MDLSGEAIFMDLLSNAVESIQVGIEDFENGARPRLLSAVRNIHSGILLLFKEALQRESPNESNNVLLMAKIAPMRDSNGKVKFVGEGQKTVDVQQIRERLTALGVNVDWKLLEHVTQVRNEIEHRFPKLDQDALLGLISNSFILIRDFITNVLHDDPLPLLGEETWGVMLEVAEVYDKEKEKSEKLLADFEWKSQAVAEGVAGVSCSSCGYDLLRPFVNRKNQTLLECMSCGEEQTVEVYAPRAIAFALGEGRYHSHKDDGEVPYVNCPDCGAKAYVVAERSCAVCEHEAQHTCERCGTHIPAEELDSEPYCGYCAYVMAKDD
jgi:hypothetical protein